MQHTANSELIEQWHARCVDADSFPKRALTKELARQLGGFADAEADIERLRFEITEAEARSDMYKCQAAACQAMLDNIVGSGVPTLILRKVG